MKYLLVIIAVIVITLIPTTALAYDPPSQSADNASDVILWLGEDTTIEISGLVDSNEDIAADLLSFFIVAFVIIVVLKNNTIVFNAIGTPVSIVYGLTLASENTVYSGLWVAGVSITLFGLVFLYRISLEAVGLLRGRKQNG